MGSFRFLLSRRWLLFGAIVLVAAYVAWLLGQWQFHRLEDRQDRNATIEANEHQDPVPAADVLARPGEELPRSHAWQLVTATGTYAPEDTVIVRYRTRDSTKGVDVLVPLVTDEGPAIIVDRGWMATGNTGTLDPAEAPAPPPGEVTITGWARVDGTGSSTNVDDRSTRAINATKVGAAIGREVYGGFVALSTEDPPAATDLARVELPELDNGPHFFYGLQWWFFGLLAIAGFGYLAWDERRRALRAEEPGAAPPDPDSDVDSDVGADLTP